jgi:glycogen debranching enzyme
VTEQGTLSNREALDADPVATVPGAVSLIEGATFCVSDATGDMSADTTQGLFFCDTRIVSTWRLTIDGRPVQPLQVMPGESFGATFLARAADGLQTDLLIERRRLIGAGMREDLAVRNLINVPISTLLTLQVDADFADLFAVKQGQLGHHNGVSATVRNDSLHFDLTAQSSGRGVRITAEGAAISQGRLQFTLALGPHAFWRTSVLVSPRLAHREVATLFPLDRPVAESSPARRMRDWRDVNPRVQTGDSTLRHTLRRSVRDLGALRITDPDRPEEQAVAAGAPWFMALFGRDSLLTSYMALPLDPSLALGTLRALARAQGRREDPVTEEQPGRILHETRLGTNFPLIRGGGSVYYGTADATPLFVVVLGELARWGFAPDAVQALLPAADRALDWCQHYGDRDGDGFIEYQRMNPSGLVNQGWKDSFDGITFADGTIPETPIALCEVQGYLYAAYRARSQLAALSGDGETAERYLGEADRLRRAFNERFWLPERGWFALGLDKDKRPIDALASNMGHCLWSGIIDQDKAEAVADALLSPQMFTGWGIRTLASSMRAFSPLSYHNGSVWPHDNALIIAGLVRYGFHSHAERVALGLLDAAAAFSGRLPELFGGFDRDEYPVPIPYPTSCSPQAWASAAPIQIVRALLGFDPDIPRQQVELAPHWPSQFGELTIANLRVGGSAATLHVSGSTSTLSGLPADVNVRNRP